MWGVFSVHGYLLGSFERFCDAWRAYQQWNAAAWISRFGGGIER